MYGDDGESITPQRFVLSKHAYMFSAKRKAVLSLFVTSMALGGIISPALYF